MHGFKVLILKNTDLSAVGMDRFFLFSFAALTISAATRLFRRSITEAK